MGSISPPRTAISDFAEQWPLQIKPHRSKTNLTAVVKGAGPAGLAAAISLAQAGFSHVLAVQKRPFRPEGHGRRNMVALRPEALRILENLGALNYALTLETGSGGPGMGCLTRMVEGKTANEWDGSVFKWPLKRYPPAEPKNVEVEEYVVPQKVVEQVPSSFINLGDLEDCLTRAAKDVGVELMYDATVNLSQDKCRETKRYRATVIRLQTFTNADLSSSESAIDLGFPDLIVCASGKGDEKLAQQLGFQRRVGVKLEEENLPKIETGSRNLRLNESTSEGEIESQLFSVYGIKTPAAPMGVLDHVIRQKDTGVPEQPVVEIQMNHAKTSHCLMQLPRGWDVANVAEIEQYIVDRTNDRLSTKFRSVQDMKDAGVLVWGDPLLPVIVETSTAPAYVFGSNVVLVGDAAMSCSPSSGIGAEVGLTVDSQSIRQLANDLKNLERRETKASSQKTARQDALNRFNLRRAEASVMWSQGSRMFYITGKEAEEILSKQNDLKTKK